MNLSRLHPTYSLQATPEEKDVPGFSIPNPFVGNSDAIMRLADSGLRIAALEHPVLIEGELGTGKKNLALWLHQNSPRSALPFLDLTIGIHRKTVGYVLLNRGVPVEAGSVDPTELQRFGDATVFIGGIERVPLEIQVHVLRFLDDISGSTSGGRNRRESRLIAASEENLGRLVELQSFSPELYSRMAHNILRVPPLRERIQDLPLLAAQFLADLSKELGYGEFELRRSALDLLQEYSWPGNLRELRTLLERVALVARRTVLSASDFYLHPSARIAQFPLQGGTLREVERQYIQRVLQDQGGRVEPAARVLGVPRSSLYHKIKEYRIERFGLRSAS